MEYYDFTRSEWNQLPTETRVHLLNQESDRKDLETAITQIGTLVKQNPEYLRYWNILKKHLNRSNQTRLRVH